MKTTFLHTFIAGAFLVSFVINVMLPSVIYVNFKLNQSFIAATLCVEKDIEESTCKGNCQLKKSLAKIEVTNPQKENFQLTVKSHITSLYLVSFPDFISEKRELVKGEWVSCENNNDQQGYFSALFRPPILS